MHLNPSRIRIAIVLVTLALCAFFAAQGTTSLVAAKWLPAAPPSRVGRGTHAGAGQELKGERSPNWQEILKRNIFDPTTGALWPPKPADPGPSPDDAAEDAPAPLGEGEMPPACEGQARLVSTIYSERLPEWSFASIAVGAQPTLLYRPGKEVDSKTLDSVYPEAVFMKTGNGALCSLVMFRPPVAAGGRAAAAPAAPAGEGVVNATPNFGGSSLGESDLDGSIKQISETKYSVQRSLIDKVLANQSELMRSARVVPHEENGKVTGVKLYGIRRSSLLGKLGLQNGDLLRTINGFDMASPDSALEAYTKLRSAGNLSVAVVRRGNPMTMDYQIGN